MKNLTTKIISFDTPLATEKRKKQKEFTIFYNPILNNGNPYNNLRTREYSGEWCILVCV